jgi:hypothetical protein
MEFPLAIIPEGFAAAGGRQGCLGPFCSGIFRLRTAGKSGVNPLEHNVPQIFVLFRGNRGLHAL